MSAADKGAWHKRLYNDLTFFGGPRRLGAAVTACELLDPAGGVDEFLFAGEKRMASSANADFNIATRRAGMIHRATRASDLGLVILRVNASFHLQKGARNLAVPDSSCKG